MRHPPWQSSTGFPITGAAIQHKDPEDAILDLGLDENLEMGITLSVMNVNKEIVEKLMKLPNTLLGLSDGGAHLAQHCDAGLPTWTIQTLWFERAKRSISEKYSIALVKSVPMRLKRRGVELRLALTDDTSPGLDDLTLLRAVARARR